MSAPENLRASVALVAAPASAHHPGERLDEVTAEREPAFEATDLRRAPALRMMGDSGDVIALSDLTTHIVVLSFGPEWPG